MPLPDDQAPIAPAQSSALPFDAGTSPTATHVGAEDAPAHHDPPVPPRLRSPSPPPPVAGQKRRIELPVTKAGKVLHDKFQNDKNVKATYGVSPISSLF